MGAAGACVGSFLATVARRWPQGAAAACSGRSACDHCGTTLRTPDLIPIVSRLLLRGRCRYCGGPVPLLETWVELAAAAVAVIVVLLAQPASWPWLLLAGWLLVLLAAIDQLHGILPDRLNLALLVSGLLSLWFDPAAPSPLDGLLGGLTAAGTFAAIAYGYESLRGRSGLGGGDVKLMGALGLWVGLVQLPWVVVLAAGGALLTALLQGGGRFDGGREIRFGPWLAAAGFAMALLGRYSAMDGSGM
ncbi:MAG TPA: prepilin peptidase [Geminicoccus sp.]|uniref:prepilin peptidase n=1 Tax=Geminicoccus sp. TaxID=2024832 RepID=UPI002CA9F9A0|nr:prepilin peptidase [Geminicoccus sp.]HWL70817.1 prepilin peptidase [Geminicoccus sp.]